MAETASPALQSADRELRPYQKDAIDSWFEHGCNSLFAMATGTGKTFTAINALQRFRQEKGYLRCVVAVPLQALTVQWQMELKGQFDDCTMINTSLMKSWRKQLEELATLAALGIAKDYLIVTTYNSLPKVIDLLVGDDHILLADEIHNMITDKRLELAVDPHFKYRLGLSATPARIWKKEDSQALAKTFGNNSFEFGIDAALSHGYLTPFDYVPHAVHLTEKEYTKYISLSHKIKKLRRQLGDVDLTSKPRSDYEKELRESLKKLYESRAYIKKNATNKIGLLLEELLELRKNGQLFHALIYVDNEKMLDALQRALLDTKIITMRYVSETSPDDRLRIINNLNHEHINAVVAIRCLDEGVDIPSARLSFILSNSTEPREYTQRLGRVLRLDKATDKKSATVNDYLVFPPEGIGFLDEEERNFARNLVKGELRRAMFFLKRARNTLDVMNSLLLEADEYGFEFEDNELYNENEKGDTHE